MTQHNHTEYQPDCFRCDMSLVDSLGIPLEALSALQAWADNLNACIEIKGFKFDGTPVFTALFEPMPDTNPG